MNTKNLEISKILIELQQIDTSLLLKALLHSAAFYYSLKCIDHISDGFILQKEKSLKNVTVKLPKEITSKKEKRNEEYRQALKEDVSFFTARMEEKLPHVDLSLLKENLKDLSIEEKKGFGIRNLIMGTIIVGKYNVKSNKITVIKGHHQESIHHELLHTASSIVDENTLFSGFSQGRIGKKSFYIGDGLNEGYTSLLEERYFSDVHNPEYSYLIERSFAKMVEGIVGKDEMESYYFKGDLYHLVENLSQYDSQENILRFLKNLDIISNHLGTDESSIYKQACQQSLLEANQFLLQAYLSKILPDVENGVLSTEDAANFANDIFSSLANNVNIEEGYDAFTTDTLNKVIQNVNMHVPNCHGRISIPNEKVLIK